MQTVAILGRQPKLSLAELEAQFGAAKVTPLGAHAALIATSPAEAVRLPLGGSLKLATLLTKVPTTDWGQLLNFCREALPEHLQDLPEGKIHFGISTYGLKLNTSSLQRAGLELKKIIKNTGRSVRVVPNQQLTLNSAQILHNKLTGPLGIELLLVANGKETYVAQTVKVQDIDEYADRDFGRPKRSGFVGMLPPKLAQIMLHLAQVKPEEVVLDPFCGTGVVLQEAALMHCKVHGTDVEPKMIDFSRTNMEWLQQKYRLTNIQLGLEQGDARTMQWQPPIGHVVCETYLGQPMTLLPSPDKLERIRQDCNQLIHDFLQNLYTQLAPSTRCCIAIPAWRKGQQFLHLPVVDQLEKLGYNRISFEHASDQDLIYHRNDQIVARELLVLTRK